MNTHRLTTLQALTIADKGGQEHRDTDRGDTLAPVARSCWLSLSRSMMMHHKGNERSQAYSLTGSYHCRHRRTGTPTQGRPLTPSLSLGLILTGEYRHRRTGGQENTDTGATTDTGDRLAPVGSRPLGL